jgi:hypothetical protein
VRLPVLCLLASAVFPSVVCAQQQDVQANSGNESWTATTQTSVFNNNPSRTTETHSKSGNRSVDKLRVEQVGINGGYQPEYETEKETVQVNPTTTRTVTRTYKWDVNGNRNLALVTEEDAQTSASGDVRVVRTNSSSDGNGNLQVMQREVADTKTTSPNAQETKTTFYLQDINGNLTPFMKTQELQKRSDEQTVEMKKTTLMPDSSGNWAVNEVKENTIKEDGASQTSEGRILRSDSEGRLSEFSRTVGKETETAAGEKRNTVETYSTVLPGLAPDGSLHLSQRVTTLQKSDPGGKSSEQQVEQPSPTDPNGPLQASTKTKYIVKYGASSTQETSTIQTTDLNGNFSAVSVETRKSDQVPAQQVQTAPSDRP